MPRPTKKDPDMPIAEILPGSPPEVNNRNALPPLVPEHIAQFLNSLPMTNDRLKWMEAFRDALQQLLGDVDRVVVSVDTYCDLLYPETYRPAIDIAQYSSSSADDAATALMTTQRTGKGRADVLLEDFQRLGYPLDDYHQPLTYNYYYAGQAYLGTIFLLRDKNKTPISQRTIDAMQTLEPFLIFALSDVVARHYYAKPLDRVFNDTLAEISRDANLSIQDFRILSSLLMGYSYKQVADLMEVSLDTIRKHIKRIYRKTRTGSLAELFAKYFTPRIGIQGLGEEDSL
jgi:DNA-binding CsgD family transcriptional regulator